jgi:hypothetical protein
VTQALHEVKRRVSGQHSACRGQVTQDLARALGDSNLHQKEITLLRTCYMMLSTLRSNVMALGSASVSA